MSGIEIAQSLAATLYLITITLTGLRLFALWVRSRKLPELLLAASLLMGGTLGSSFEGAGLAGSQELDAEVVGRLLLIGKVFGMMGLACQAEFVRRVFRSQESWALWLAVGLAACPGLALVGFGAAGTFVTGQIPALWFVVELVGRVGVLIWMVVEAIRYYRVMGRRLRIGLADPVVSNRFLIWALAAGFALVLMLTSIPPTFLSSKTYGMILVADLAVFTFCGVTASVLYALAFFPPAAYKRWLVDSAPATS